MLRFHDENQSSGAVRENVVYIRACGTRSGKNSGIVNVRAGVSYIVETALKGGQADYSKKIFTSKSFNSSLHQI